MHVTQICTLKKQIFGVIVQQSLWALAILHQERPLVHTKKALMDQNTSDHSVTLILTPADVWPDMQLADTLQCFHCLELTSKVPQCTSWPLCDLQSCTLHPTKLRSHCSWLWSLIWLQIPSEHVTSSTFSSENSYLSRGISLASWSSQPTCNNQILPILSISSGFMPMCDQWHRTLQLLDSLSQQWVCCYRTDATGRVWHRSHFRWLLVILHLSPVTLHPSQVTCMQVQDETTGFAWTLQFTV